MRKLLTNLQIETKLERKNAEGDYCSNGNN